MNGIPRFTTLSLPALLLAVAGCGDGPSDPSGGGPGTDALNLRVAGMYIVQSTQTRTGSVPLVAGKDGYLRVFAVANRENTAAPSVRVRLYHGETLRETWTLPAGSSSVTTEVNQGSLNSSWNVRVPGALIQPGMRIVAEVDPENRVAEADEGDNAFPASGTPQAMQVAALAPLKLRLVPILQSENGLVGRVSEANKEEFLTFTRKIHPVAQIDVDVRAVYTTNATFDPQGNSWAAIVSELDAVRVADGSDRYYYGVVRPPYSGSGVAGIAAGLGSRTSLGWDLFPDADETLAHELGHNWGRRHSPCNGAGGADPNYPYAVGQIGVYGMDVETGELKAPSAFTDIMGYCDASWWISDYTYRGVFEYRLQNDGGASASRGAQPSLLVWGRIQDGKVTLEPAFQVTTRPVLPSAPGPYRIEGLDAAGSAVFSISFAAERIPDLPGDHRVFAFAVPLGADQGARLATLRLVGSGVEARSRSSSMAAAGTGARTSRAAGPRLAATRSAAGEVSLRWDASIHPVVMVRDPRTGQVLSLARGGSAGLRAAGGELELVLSDGVRSELRRVQVGGL